MSATHDRNLLARLIGSVPMAAGADIAEGDFVCGNGADYHVPGADTAGLIFRGMAVESKTNRRVIPTAAVDTGTEVITYSAHGFAEADPIVYNNGGGTSLAPLVSGTTYYAKNIAAGTFQVAATAGGAAINLTGTGNNAQYFSKDGGETVQIIRHPGVMRVASGITAADQGKMMFITGAQTFAATATNLIWCGRLGKYNSATEGYLNQTLLPKKFRESFREPGTWASKVGWTNLLTAPFSTDNNVIIRRFGVALGAAPGGANTINFCMQSGCTGSILQVSGGSRTGSSTGLSILIPAYAAWVFRANESAGSVADDPQIKVEGDEYETWDMES